MTYIHYRYSATFAPLLSQLALGGPTHSPVPGLTALLPPEFLPPGTSFPLVTGFCFVFYFFLHKLKMVVIIMVLLKSSRIM
jgi:hypothetical protein